MSSRLHVNGDGFDDLGFGIPGEDHLGENDAGRCRSTWAPSRESTPSATASHQSTAGIPDDVGPVTPS